MRLSFHKWCVTYWRITFVQGHDQAVTVVQNSNHPVVSSPFEANQLQVSLGFMSHPPQKKRTLWPQIRLTNNLPTSCRMKRTYTGKPEKTKS